MNSRTDETFGEGFNALPDAVQKLAKRVFALWQTDSFHPSLHFKPVKRGAPSVWSVRIGQHYRALGYRENVDGQDTIFVAMDRFSC